MSRPVPAASTAAVATANSHCNRDRDSVRSELAVISFRPVSNVVSSIDAFVGELNDLFTNSAPAIPNSAEPGRAALAKRFLEIYPPTRWTAHALLVILMTMTTMSLAEVKAHLSELVGRVSNQHERLTVTVHGRPSAVLLAVEDLESLEETIAVLSDADALRDLIEAEAEIARGEGETEEQLGEAMRRRSAPR